MPLCVTENKKTKYLPFQTYNLKAFEVFIRIYKFVINLIVSIIIIPYLSTPLKKIVIYPWLKNVALHALQWIIIKDVAFLKSAPTT